MSDKPAFDLEVFEERVRRNLGRVMFAARWIVAPIYLGLLVALLLVVVKFVQTLVQTVPGFLALTTEQAIFFILTLVDLSLVANLVVIVMFAVGRRSSAGCSPRNPTTGRIGCGCSTSPR
jgi:hypothetical protein